MMTRRISTLALLLLFIPTAARFASAQAVFGTEIFITHDWGATSSTGGTTYWDNVTLLDASGIQYVITFTNVASTANGIYGPINADGPYNVEYFWLQTGVPGITTGHNHNYTASGNPGSAEGNHYNVGLGDRQGIRITRQDGAAFSLFSIDYASATEAFQIGTSYNQAVGYTDIATNWVRFGTTNGLVLNSPTFNTMQFLPPDVSTVKLVQNPAPTVNFSPAQGTFSINGTVASYVATGNIEVTSASVDPLVGATVTISGSYAGTDLTGLSNLVLTPCSTSIIVNGGDQLQILNQLAYGLGGPDQFRLSGNLGAMPTRFRGFGQNGPNTLTRIGSGSVVLDTLNTKFQTEAMTMIFELGTSGPVLRSIEKAYVPPTPAKAFNFATDGFGAAVMGMVNYGIGSQVYNVFTLSPTNTTVGSGAFYGIQFGPTQLGLLSLPLITNPAHVLTNVDGSYFWGVPSGSVPAGLVVDCVSIEVPLGSATVGFVSPVRRVTF